VIARSRCVASRAATGVRATPRSRPDRPATDPRPTRSAAAPRSYPCSRPAAAPTAAVAGPGPAARPPGRPAARATLRDG